MLSYRNNYSELSNHQLIELIHKTNDEKIKEIFILKNQGLIYSTIKRFISKGNKEDLFQIGCIGLMKALNNFDLSKEYQFSTYAIPIILGEIKRSFRDDQSMRISRSIKENYIKMVQSKEKLIQLYQRQPSYEEIALDSKTSIEEVYIAFDAHQYILSMDEEIYESDGKILTLNDQISKDENDLILTMSLSQEIGFLSKREQLILYFRYYLGYKQSEIAIRLHCTQVQVSRIEKQILLKLKNRMIK
ncbi:MAG: sigma-70 family RNA polymerase sigma factor [Traorella sp.]